MKRLIACIFLSLSLMCSGFADLVYQPSSARDNRINHVTVDDVVLAE